MPCCGKKKKKIERKNHIYKKASVYTVHCTVILLILINCMYCTFLLEWLPRMYAFKGKIVVTFNFLCF